MHPKYSIIIENNDRKIWHRDRVLLDLLSLATTNKDLRISLNQEGPCAHSLGLYSILDDICDRTGLSKDKITIDTCNLLERHTEYQIKKIPPIKHVTELQQQIKNNQLPVKDVSAIAKHFGHFMGHSSRHRLVIASWLWKNHRDKTRQTFHSTPTHELHREFLGLEDLWFNGYGIDHVKNAVEFLTATPIKYDPVDEGPILHMKMYGILGAYADIFLDIVCNTYISGQTFYVDEKLWRPIITKTPFIVHGPRDFIRNFKKLGFRTFDRWWDEGYSEDSAECQTQAILDIIDRISTYSITDLKNLYDEMRPILNHNYDIFLSLQRSSFLIDFENV